MSSLKRSYKTVKSSIYHSTPVTAVREFGDVLYNAIPKTHLDLNRPKEMSLLWNNQFGPWNDPFWSTHNSIWAHHNALMARHNAIMADADQHLRRSFAEPLTYPAPAPAVTYTSPAPAVTYGSPAPALPPPLEPGLHQESLTQKPNGDFEYTCNALGYRPEELAVDVEGDNVVVAGRHQDSNKRSRFYKRFTLPLDADPESLRCDVDDRGMLSITGVARPPSVQYERSRSGSSLGRRTPLPIGGIHGRPTSAMRTISY